MSDQTRQQQINAILWRVCSSFCGTVAPAECRSYFLVSLSGKYVSEVWHDHCDAYRARYEDDPERIRRRMRHNTLVLPEGSDPGTTRHATPPFPANCSSSLWSRSKKSPSRHRRVSLGASTLTLRPLQATRACAIC